MTFMNDSTNIDEFFHFAEFLEKLKFGQYNDPFEVLKCFSSVISKKAFLIAEKTETDDSFFVWYNLECKVWNLLDRLLTFRNSELPPNFPIYQYSSDAAIQEHKIRKTPRSRENWIVILWLQHFLASPSEPSDIIGTKWLYTKNNIAQTQLTSLSKASSNIITEFDVDAPLRQKKIIENEDKLYDEQVFRYLFELIQAGKYKEACHFCDLTGNLSLSLAISGIYEYFDSLIEGSNLHHGSMSGILNKALWRRMCWQLTQDNNLSLYERGIYGILSSDISSVLALSSTWETQLLLYLSSLVASEAEQSLFEKNRIDREVALVKIPQMNFQSSAEILNLLSNSSNPQIKEESQHSCRRFISAIINNELDFIVDDTAKKIDYLLQNEDEIEENGQDLENSIRFAIHVMLFLQQLGQKIGKEQNRDTIIQTYIEILRTSNRSDLIPLYVSYLSDETALTAYSIVLADIEESNERQMHITLSKKYGLDIENTIRRAVSQIFDLYDEKYTYTPTFEFTSEVSEADKRICKAVEWYVDNSMWADCIHTSILLYRMLLNMGRIQTARDFSKLIPIKNILKSYKTHQFRVSMTEDFELSSIITDDLETELKEYERLLNCLDSLEMWNIHYNISLKSKNQSQSHFIPELWKRDAITLSTKVSDSIHDFCATWLFKITESEKVDDATKQLIFRLRTRYIPFLLIELLRVFIEAQLADPAFLREAAALATFVASEDLKLYNLFVESGRLSLFLETIADACADGVINGESGIFE